MKKETSFYGESQSLCFNGKFSTESCVCRRQTLCLHAAFVLASNEVFHSCNEFSTGALVSNVDLFDVKLT